MAGYIYVFHNPSFPEYVKIGYADDVTKRLKELNHMESIPYAFRAYCKYKVHYRLTDKALHKLIDTLNPTLRSREVFHGTERVKEFFKMTKEEAYDILFAVAKISGTESRLTLCDEIGHDIEQEIPEEKTDIRVKKCRLKFVDLGIPIGSELVYVGRKTDVVKNEIKVVTCDDVNQVLYNNVKQSISALAGQLLNVSAAQGGMYFTYQGERLTDRRERLERETQKKESDNNL